MTSVTGIWILLGGFFMFALILGPLITLAEEHPNLDLAFAYVAVVFLAVSVVLFPIALWKAWKACRE